MGGGSKDCIGCDEPFSEGNYDSVMFNIMHIRHSSDEYGPMRIREKDSVVRIHRKCLAEHVWKVKEYADSCELADVEVEQWIHGQNLKHQLLPMPGNDWGLRLNKEGGWMRDYRGFVFNKDVDNLVNRIIENQDLCLVIFFKDNVYSPPVLYPMNDPMLLSNTSTPEYKEKIAKAIEEYKKECVKIKKITNDPKEKILRAGISCIHKFNMLLSCSGDEIKPNPNESDVPVKEKGKTPLANADEDPIKTLKMRYAKGEISKEEFEEIKKDLE